MKWKNYQDVTEALGIYDLSDKYLVKFLEVNNNVQLLHVAFVHQPSIIFADEPTGALDSKVHKILLHRLEI